MSGTWNLTRFRAAELLLSACIVASLAGCKSEPSRSDYGPPGAVAAIRHDLPLLLADQLDALTPSVDMVVTDGYEAVATWHTRKYRGLVVFYRDDKSGRWWWHAATSSESGRTNEWSQVRVPGESLDYCGSSFPGPPSGHDLLMAGWISELLATRLSNRLAYDPPSNIEHVVFCDGPGGDFVDGTTDGGFDLQFSHHNFTDVRFVLIGNARRTGERRTVSNAKLVYEFLFSATQPKAATFPRGSTLTLWCPYVLDTKARYSLSLAGARPAFLSVRGNLKNNVLSFTIPGFSLQAGKILFGDITETQHTQTN